MKKIYLVDVSSMFFRAYYAIRPLSSPTGVPVNAVYGFLSMISKLMKEEKPDYMVFCYDRKEPSFRKEMYDDYKANRSAMPEDLAVQIPYIKKLADFLGVPSLEVPLFEADDLIGTLVKFSRRQGLEAVIVSGDKDFAQLIEENVILFDTMKDVRYDSGKVFEKWGVKPERFLDYLAIVGDASDNVPGVKGIGEKGAIKLLEQFSSLEEIYENIAKIESKSIKQKLIDSKEMAFLSRKLVTIVCDVDVPQNIEEYQLRPFKATELRQLLQELNFKTFEKNLLGDAGVSAAHANFEMASAEARVNSSKSPTQMAMPVLTSLAPASVKHVDRELTEIQMNLFSLQKWLDYGEPLWGHADERAVYLHKGSEIIVFEGDWKTLGPVTDKIKIQWQGYDLKNFWHKIGARNPKILWDSQLAAYALKAADASDFAKILFRETGESLPEFASPTQIMLANLTLQATLNEKIKNQNCEAVYTQLDLPLPPILLSMENAGIRVDRELLAQQSVDLGHDIAALEKEIHALAGEVFNVASPKQLGVVLFEKLDLPVGKKTKTGYSTDTDVLEGLNHPIAKLVLQFREFSKLKSTYVDALPTMIAEDGRVHTNLQQALTTTGRLSSNNPNLQNIPIRTARGQLVRKAFIAAEGKKLLSVDYSQIELRILAHISEDPNMCKAFAEDLDIHSATAAEIYNVPLKEVTPELRRAAKAVNFGIAYGQGPFGLAENLRISRGEAQEIIKRYFERFKNVRDYIESTVKSAYENGYVETLAGRRRYLDELKNKSGMIKKFGERAAVNAPIQGTASDLVKKAMIDLARTVPVPMLLQVHDELIFEESEEVLKKHIPKIVEIMENVAQLRVPLKVNYAMGNNWDEAH